jgi:transcriptional regulator with XRE-family HTH domain
MASHSTPSTRESDRSRPNLTPGDPILRRRIARKLRELREEKAVLLEDVARETRVSTSTLSRLENAQGSANAPTMRALVNYYELSDIEGARLEQWAKDGRKHGWWQDFPEASEKIGGYVAYESQATVAKLYVIPFIPVLLQTADYSRALSRIYYPDCSEAELTRLVAFQQHRQEILEPRTGRPALRLRVILHESCIRQRVGSLDVMLGQLETMEDRARKHKNIQLQVLPMNQEAHKAMNGTWTLFEYADDMDSNVALLENPQGLVVAQLMENPSEVSNAAKNFDQLSKLSMIEQDSLKLIETVRDSLRAEIAERDRKIASQ